MVQQPAHFDHQGCAIFKADKGRGKIFHIPDRLINRCAKPAGKLPRLVRQRRFGHARHHGRRWVAHQPEGEIKHMDADVDTRATATVLFLHKTAAGDKPIAAQHPTAGMVNITQDPRFNLALHRLRNALEAKMLGGHQLFAGLVAGRDHLTDFARSRGQWLFADHMFTRFQRGNRQRGMVHVGRADIDDVNIWVTEEFSRIRDQFGHAVLLPPRVQRS